MATKCKVCSTKLDKTELICRVCNVRAGKDGKDLTKEEKKIQYYCHALRVVGFLSALGGVFGMADVVLRSFAGVPNSSVLVLYLFKGVLSVVFLAFGLAVMKYRAWCYAGGIVLLSLAILENVFQFNIFRLLIQILLLSYVAAPTSKKILYREL